MFGALVIDVTAREVTLGGEPVGLTKTEFDLLDTLSERPRVAFARSLLLERVRGADDWADKHLADVHIGHLRRKLGDDAPVTPGTSVRSARSATGWARNDHAHGPTGAPRPVPGRRAAPAGPDVAPGAGPRLLLNSMLIVAAGATTVLLAGVLLGSSDSNGRATSGTSGRSVATAPELGLEPAALPSETVGVS